jgi:hypothetical protein
MVNRPHVTGPTWARIMITGNFQLIERDLAERRALGQEGCLPHAEAAAWQLLRSQSSGG